MSESGRPLKIVSFARAIPYSGVPHAGGAYLRNHLGVLSADHNICLVVPGTSRNIGDKNKLDLPLELIVVPVPRGRSSVRVQKLLELVFPAVAPWCLFRGLAVDHELRDKVSSADIVEFQWSEYASLASRVRKLNTKAHLVGVAHDVLRQKYRRRMQASRALKDRIRSYLGYWTTTLIESKTLKRLDSVLVFSDKDKDLFSESLQNKTSVVNPPFTALGSGISVSGRVLFTGALSRPENDEGIRWFIRECWDTVVEMAPHATLYIAGANPTTELMLLVKGKENIVVSGYLDDLDGVYPTASVFINPVHTGAGVKFKTITAMLYGNPVVSTTVGAEGVGTSVEYFSVTDRPNEFAHAVASALLNQKYASKIGNAAQSWAQSKYGWQEFEQTLKSMYSSGRLDSLHE